MGQVGRRRHRWGIALLKVPLGERGTYKAGITNWNYVRERQNSCESSTSIWQLTCWGSLRFVESLGAASRRTAMPRRRALYITKEMVTTIPMRSMTIDFTAAR